MKINPLSFLKNALLFLSGCSILFLVLSRDWYISLPWFISILALFYIFTLLWGFIIYKYHILEKIPTVFSKRTRGVIFLLTFGISLYLLLRNGSFWTLISTEYSYISGLFILLTLASLYAVNIIIKYLTGLITKQNTDADRILKKILSIIDTWKSYCILAVSIALLVVLYNLHSLLSAGTQWNLIIWTFDYSYGFIPRGLLGTLMQGFCALTGLQLSPDLWRATNLIGTLLFTAAILGFIFYTVKKITASQSAATSRNIKLITLLFLIGAGLSSYYELFGSPDIYLILLTIPVLCLILSEKHKLLQFISILILPVICMLIHSGYVFLFFNIILALLLYKSFITRTNRVNRYYLTALIASFTACSILFIYFQFFAQVNPDITLEYVLEKASVLTVVESDTFIKYLLELLFGSSGLLGTFYGISSQWTTLLINLVIYSPFIWLAYKLWKGMVKNATGLKQKTVYILISLGFLTTVPLFIMHVDYGRWCYAVFFYEIALMLCLTVAGDKPFITSLNDVFRFLLNKPVLAVFLVLYVLLLGQFSIGNINLLEGCLNLFIHTILP